MWCMSVWGHRPAGVPDVWERLPRRSGNVLADYETSPDFPSPWECVDDVDEFLIFGWTHPFKAAVGHIR